MTQIELEALGSVRRIPGKLAEVADAIKALSASVKTMSERLTGIDEKLGAALRRANGE